MHKVLYLTVQEVGETYLIFANFNFCFQLDESEHMKSLRTLELFAYGKWGDYRDSLSSNAPQYIALNETQTTKLKQLTIVALAEQNKVYNVLHLCQYELPNIQNILRSTRDFHFPNSVVVFVDTSNFLLILNYKLQLSKIIEYSTLLKELDIDSVRVLEDLIIETIYAVSEA